MTGKRDTRDQYRVRLLGYLDWWIASFLTGGRYDLTMSFEEDETVVLNDEHSEYNGEEGTITQKVETMFGDANYTVSFEDGQVAGVPEDNLEPAE